MTGCALQPATPMLPAVLARYRSFLRQPDLAATFALTWFARLPIATVTLSLLLFVRERTGSFASAGAAAGAYLVASACTAPIAGRWIDRHGPRLALALTGTVCPLALFAVLGADPLGLGATGIAAFAALAGAFAPPITVLTRTSLRQRFTSERDRSTAFALDTVLVEMAFTLGPLLIAALLATGGPTLAFGGACILVLLATPAFAVSPAPRYLRRVRDADRSLLGPLGERRLLVVYATVFLITLNFGLLEVAYPAYGTSLGTQALGALLIAVNSVGSAIGGIAYGGMDHDRKPARQLPALLALMAVPVALQALLPGPWTLALLAFAAGLLIAPALTIVMLLVSDYAPAHYATEAFTWASTCVVAGIGAGAAIGGRLVESWGPAAPFAAAAACIALAVAAARANRSR